MRYAALVAEKLPQHPSAGEPDNRAGLKAARKTLPMVLDTLEVIKPRINARYAAWENDLERRREASLKSGHGRAESWPPPDTAAASDPAVAGNTTTLGAAENSELAVKLAHKEIRRRDAARKATRQAGVSEQEEQERRTAGLWDDWEAALSKDGAPREDDTMRENMENMEAARRKLDGAHDIVSDTVMKKPSKPRPRGMNGNSEYRYPSITRSMPLQYQDDYKVEPQAPPSIPQHLPPKPPKDRIQDMYDPQPPRRPNKAPPEPPEPDMSKSKVPPTFTFRPSAYLENGNPLRTVFLPPTLRTEFLRYAESNTRRNLETCGMLCGTLISNALFIQRVVIPEQKNTSDTCEMINESDFFDYCMSEDLMCLGWIHTHPTQTCFMSSRDLHTHNAYQAMMAESIAIVCAPSKNPS
jgi:STAM-binding protein